MNKPSQMPGLDFDVYMFTKVIEIEALSDIVDAIVEAHKVGLQQVKELAHKHGEDYVLLISVVLYGMGEWEIRLWATDDDIILIDNIDDGYNTGSIYKAVIEVFAIKKKRMAHVLEGIKLYGLSPHVISRTLLSTHISKLLRIGSQNREDMVIEDKIKRDAGRDYTSTINLDKGASVVSHERENIWSTIGECLMNAGSMGIQDEADDLIGRGTGVLVFTKGSSYICIMGQARGCKWLVITISLDSSSKRCINDSSIISDLVNELINNGYKNITKEIAAIVQGTIS